MKTPTQDLSQEHGGIVLMLEIMGQVATKLERGESVEKEHLAKIVEFIQIFADKCHHGKEEGILFPILFETESNKQIINELLGDHKTGRDFIRGIVESLDQYEAGNADAYHIAVNMQSYIWLLTKHIQKENTILFPLASEQISEEEQAEIEERFEAFEREVIGEGKHEQYHGWLDELKAIYLP